MNPLAPPPPPPPRNIEGCVYNDDDVEVPVT